MKNEVIKISGVFIIHAALAALGFIALGGVLFYLSVLKIIPDVATFVYLIVAVIFLIPFFSAKHAARVVHKKYPSFSDWNKVFLYSGLFIFLIGGLNPILEVMQRGGGTYGSGYILIAGVLFEIFWARYFLLKGAS